MKVTLSLKTDLIDQIKALAEQEHRSISGQVAHFCERALTTTETTTAGTHAAADQLPSAKEPALTA